MSAETDLIALFEAEPLVANVARGIFLNAADETTPLPYVVVTATHNPELLLDGSTDMDQVTFTIAVWAAGAATCEALADKIESLLDAHDEYAVTARIGGFDQETGNDATVLTADRWL